MVSKGFIFQWKRQSVFGESAMKAHDGYGARGSTWRNKSCSCLKMAARLRLLYSTHYYQEILTLASKEKGGGTARLDFKGCLASIFFSLELPLIP